MHFYLLGYFGIILFMKKLGVGDMLMKRWGLKMKKHNCKCNICEKEIIIEEQTFGSRLKTYKDSPGQTTTLSTSKDGIYFIDISKKYRAWFCNDCWKKLTKSIFSNKKIKGGKTNVDKKR